MLDELLSAEAPTELMDFSPTVRPLILEVTSRGGPEPIPGYEVPDDDLSGWIVEAAWEKQSSDIQWVSAPR